MKFSDIKVPKNLHIDGKALGKTLEMHSKDAVQKTIEQSYSNDPFMKQAVTTIMMDAPDWLPFAAEQYYVSPNIKDYVIVPVVIVPSDIPNRNMVAFPFDELTKFNIEAGKITYQTWVGKPTYYEHINRDPTQARGVVFDASIRKIEGTNISKVITLCGFDRTKDSQLTDMIIRGEREYYSMGARVENYTCSVCGSSMVKNANNPKQLACGNSHVDPMSGRFKVFDTSEGNILGHYNAHEITGYEVSSVSWPAWPSAYTTNDKHLMV